MAQRIQNKMGQLIYEKGRVEVENEAAANAAINSILSFFDSKEEFRDTFPSYTTPDNPETLIPRICHNCNNLYAITQNGVWYSWFCSTNCRKEWYDVRYPEHTLQGRLNIADKPLPNDIRLATRKQDNYCCHYCGIPQAVTRYFSPKSRRQSAHHLTKRQQILTYQLRDHPNNMHYSCQQCHQRIHRRMEDLEHEAREINTGSETSTIYPVSKLKKWLKFANRDKITRSPPASEEFEWYHQSDFWGLGSCPE